MPRKPESFKKRIFDILQIGQSNDHVSRLFDYLLVCVIVVNIITMILETFDEFSGYDHVFALVEIICIVFFSIEYLLRIWTAPILYPDRTPAGAVWHFVISFDGIVELLTIIPLYFLSGFVVFRMLRVVRIFHLFRLNSNYDSFHVITTVLKKRKNQILSSVFIMFVLMLAASLCMYSAEHDAQPEVFDNAFSGLWWCVSTILTIGYGDVYPVTAFGRILAIIIAILGVGVVAIPTGIISAGFVEQYTKMQSADRLPLGTIAMNADADSGIIGLGLEQLTQRFGIVPLVIIRDGNIIIPTDDVIIAEGDTLVYHTEKANYE